MSYNPKPRSAIIEPTETVSLTVQFRDSNHQPADLDSFPSITIIQPSGGVALGPTSAGVYRLETGKYGYDFKIGFVGPIGVWTDMWTGELNGVGVNGSFNFVVHTTQMPALNTDGNVHLGDDPGFHYSPVEIENINSLMKTLRARLKSSGKVKRTDEYGNVIYKDCDIYSVDELTSFIANSLTSFNQIPHFTMFTFNDTEIIKQFHDVLVQGATISALAAQALIERGREFTIQDQGIGWNNAAISDMLNTQHGAELQNWFEKVKMIKANMKPSPLGLGVFTTTAASPQVQKLRHLRARRFY